MSQSTKNALSVFALVILAGAFWLLLISPKKDKADELQKQVSALQSEVAGVRQDVAAGVAAKKSFSHSYQQLILLGKAVPADSGTASLLVQLNAISTGTDTPFEAIELKEGGAEAVAPTEGEGAEGENVDALPPLGSSAGPAGLRAMPYELSFVGGFFDAADFISRVDSLVQTKDGRLYADGRLLTFDSFEMSLPSATTSGPSYKHLDLKFSATAYATPFGQGLTAGASSTGPEIE